MDQIAGKKRYALKVGPIVMACVSTRPGGIDPKTNAPVVPVAADNATIKDWLLPVAGRPLNFDVKVRRPLRPATCRFDWDFPVRRLFLSRNIEGATDAAREHPASSSCRCGRCRPPSDSRRSLSSRRP